VTVRPFWNRTPGRRCMVYRVPPSLMSTDAAALGNGPSPSAPKIIGAAVVQLHSESQLIRS